MIKQISRNLLTVLLIRQAPPTEQSIKYLSILEHLQLAHSNMTDITIDYFDVVIE